MFGIEKVMDYINQLKLAVAEVNERTKRIETKLHRLASHQGADLTEDRLYAKRGSEEKTR